MKIAQSYPFINSSRVEHGNLHSEFGPRRLRSASTQPASDLATANEPRPIWEQFNYAICGYYWVLLVNFPRNPTYQIYILHISYTCLRDWGDWGIAIFPQWCRSEVVAYQAQQYQERITRDHHKQWPAIDNNQASPATTNGKQHSKSLRLATIDDCKGCARNGHWKTFFGIRLLDLEWSKRMKVKWL